MKKILTIVIAVLGSGCFAGAQTVIKNEKLTKDADKVTVSFDIETDVKGLPSRRKEIISPYLYYFSFHYSHLLIYLIILLILFLYLI